MGRPPAVRAWNRFNQVARGLRFFYRVPLGRPDVGPKGPYGRRAQTLPSVLSPAAVARLRAALPDDRYRLLAQTACAGGLRLPGVLGLPVGDLDGRRRVLHVRQAKGREDRLVPLPPRLLEELRASWRRYRPATWLFPGHRPGRPLHPAALQRLSPRVVRAGAFGRRGSGHTLRPS